MCDTNRSRNSRFRSGDSARRRDKAWMIADDAIASLQRGLARSHVRWPFPGTCPLTVLRLHLRRLAG